MLHTALAPANARRPLPAWQTGRLRVYVYLSDPRLQERLVELLSLLCRGAEVEPFRDRDALLERSEEHPPDVAFLSDTYGMLSGVSVGRQLDGLRPRSCSLIFVTDSSAHVAGMWEIPASGRLRTDFTCEAVAEQLANLRYPPRTALPDRPASKLEKRGDRHGSAGLYERPLQGL